MLFPEQPRSAIVCFSEGAHMQTAKVKWIGEQRFVATGPSGHALAIDSDRASNEAPGPMELLLMALGACTATDVVNILRKKREPFTNVEVRAEAERAAEPPTVYRQIKLTYKIGGQVSKKAAEDAVRLSKEKYCSVSAMLQKTAKITSVIEYA